MVFASRINGQCRRRLGATRAPVIWTTASLHILPGPLERADLRADLDFVAVENLFDQDYAVSDARHLGAGLASILMLPMHQRHSGTLGRIRPMS